MWPLWLAFALFIYLAFGHWIKAQVSSVWTRVLERVIDPARAGLGGSARFCGLIEEWAFRWQPHAPGAQLPAHLKGWKWWLYGKILILTSGAGKGGQIFIGRSLYNRSLHIGNKDDRHMLTIAGSRAGKGASCIIPNLLTFEGSILCIDPKGINTTVTARRRREMGQKVYIVDPMNLVTKTSDSFNPLEHLDLNSPTLREAIGVLGDAMVVNDPNNRMGSHWEDGAKTVINGLVGHLINDPKYRVNGKPPTPYMIRELIGKRGDDFSALVVDMATSAARDAAAATAGGRIARGAGTEEITNILGNVDKHTEWLTFPSMRGIMETSTFHFSELKTRPTTIYLVIPPALLELHNRFLRLFINLAIAQIPNGGKSKIPILFMLDEFLQLGRMNSIPRAFRVLAGYNFTVWPFVQELEGLQKLYDKDTEAFFSNARGLQVFSVDDEVTTALVSKKLGKRSMRHVRGVDDTKANFLREPEEVAKEVERDRGLQYFMRAGRPTMLLERVKYFENPLSPQHVPAIFRPMFRKLYPFAGLYDADPDYKE